MNKLLPIALALLCFTCNKEVNNEMLSVFNELELTSFEQFEIDASKAIKEEGWTDKFINEWVDKVSLDFEKGIKSLGIEIPYSVHREYFKCIILNAKNKYSIGDFLKISIGQDSRWDNLDESCDYIFNDYSL